MVAVGAAGVRRRRRGGRRLTAAELTERAAAWYLLWRMTNPAPSPPVDFIKLAGDAGELFHPHAPIDQRDLFAGRLEQVGALLGILRTKGQHAIIHGERGVGKTSLVSILSELTAGRMLVVRLNCGSDDTFGQLWSRAARQLKILIERPGLGFAAKPVKEVVQLIDLDPNVGPHDVGDVLANFDVPAVFVFDEFDQLTNKTVSKHYSELIKSLSDTSSPAKVVLVGVGDSVDALVEYHPSVERALRQIHMPRMTNDELGEIISKIATKLGMTFDKKSTSHIVRLSQGLPHYVHLVGLHSTLAALAQQRLTVDSSAVRSGIAASLKNVSQTLLNSYLSAVASQRKDALYQDVLLACALATTDELNYFRPAAVRDALRRLGRKKIEIPAFAAHLNKFTQPERGSVLKKIGSERQFRYRFRNPLLAPFVLMRGISEKTISEKDLD